MPTLLLLMIGAAIAVTWWSAARDAAERAEDLGREACAAAGVQWLDQTVHASGVRLRRGVERTFRFEYSEDGSDRHIGRLVLRGRRLVGFVGPVRSNVATMH